MLIGELEELIKRNEVYPQIRFVASRWGKRQGAPEGSLTIVVGDWPMTEKYGQPYLSHEHKDAYNVSCPFVPADTVEDEEGGIVARGYRWLLRDMVAKRYIYPSKEVLAVIQGEAR